MIMPANRSPMETSAVGPSRMTTTDGGMMVPRDPPAQIVPAISVLLYA
jgi:hypothetical protein